MYECICIAINGKTCSVPLDILSSALSMCQSQLQGGSYSVFVHPIFNPCHAEYFIYYTPHQICSIPDTS